MRAGSLELKHVPLYTDIPEITRIQLQAQNQEVTSSKFSTAFYADTMDSLRAMRHDAIIIETCQLNMMILDRNVLQCETCREKFTTIRRLEEHIGSVHGFLGKKAPLHKGNKPISEENAEDFESTLLKRIKEQGKARKRTRGPYRKSAA